MLVRRDSRTGANDLHTVYRPCTVDEMLGNQTNRNMIKKGLERGDLSHTFLFTGDYGCGKTTAARVIALGLNCDKGISPNPCLECDSCKATLNQNNLDVLEINVGQSGGKDAVDNIAKDLASSPFFSKFKILIFDEAHKLTDAAQALLLKIIEDGYQHVYFIFCTNKPEKLTDAFISRCNVMHFSRISKDVLLDLLKNVAEFEAMEYSSDVLELIASEARGVPRDALVWLGQVANEGSWTIESAKEVINILMDESDPQIVEISKALLRGSFTESFKLYDKISKKAQAESVRIGIAAYISGCLKRAKSYKDADKFSEALNIVTVPIYEQGKPGDYKLYNYLYKISKVLR